jgi:uncharacterized small protein (DUF1192 family)
VRQYQDLLRSEIHEREQAVRAERDELRRACDALYRDVQNDVYGDLASLARGQALDVVLEMDDRVAALDHAAAEFGAEILIRDKPEEDQEQYGGPGKD